MHMLRAIYQNFSIEWKSTIRYAFGFVSDIVIYGALLVVFMVSDTGQSFGEEYHYADYKVLFLIGYLAWLYAVTAVCSLSRLVTTEIKQGTFYRLCNAKYPLAILLSGKMIAQFVIQSGIVVGLLLAVGVIGKVRFPFSLVLIAVMIISTIGMYGIGMALSGLTIYYKKTGSIIYLVQLGLLFMTDTLPTSDIVAGVTTILPLTTCNAVMRKVIAGQAYWTEMIFLIFISVICLVLGMGVLQFFYNKARRKGNLLFY